MIAKVPLFAELDAGEIADISELLRAQLAEPGEVIVREGDHAHSMYFIAAGEVEVALEKKKVKLGVGQFFGEVAVLRRERRAGTATALTRTNLLALSAQDLHALMKRDSRIAERIKDVVEKRTGRKVDPSRGRRRRRSLKPASSSSGTHNRRHKARFGTRRPDRTRLPVGRPEY